MKRVIYILSFIFLLVGVAFAQEPIQDSDNDGFEDLVDVCPFVYGSDNYDGCPYVQIFNGRRDERALIRRNRCYDRVSDHIGYIFGKSLCTDNELCTRLIASPALNRCDIIYPMIMLPGGTQIQRGPVYVIE